MKLSQEIPVIFWHSAPVRPDETVMVSGHLLGKGTKIELVFTENGKSGKPAAGAAVKWDKALTPEIISQENHRLAFVVPANLPTGIYACRAVRGKLVSEAFLVNAPDCWWTQGERGLGAAVTGGWFRVLGKSLNHGGTSTAVLRKNGSDITLPVVKASMYSLEFSIPDNTPAGEYDLYIHNGCGGTYGWRQAGTVHIQTKSAACEIVMNVVDCGADPEGLKDSTFAIVQAMERLTSYGGGIVYFPSGRYRIDSILRTGTFISSPLVIPKGISFKGESRDMVSLWWPDKQEPLYSLIECMGDNTISDLSIFTQGRHRNIITADTDNITIKNILVRANCYYMCGAGGKPHHRRGVNEEHSKMGNILEFNNCSNIQVESCDLYGSASVMRLKHVKGGRIANCKAYGTNFGEFAGGNGNIIENIDYAANSLTAWGGYTSLHYGAVRNQHLYFADNKIKRIYGGDHEAFTLDGHGTAYIGSIAKISGSTVTLAGDPVTGMDGIRDNLPSLEKTTLYILAGRGRGQYRHVESYKGRELVLETPFSVEPDKDSTISVGAFNGQHLIVGNSMEDTGTFVQLYPPNCECIVAENNAIRCSNMNSCSKLGRNLKNRFQRVEISWYNQFLDNRVIVGNGWGGGESEIDRWLGGEGTLNIWGWQVRFYVDELGADQDGQLTEQDLEELTGRKNLHPGQALALSIFQIIRRHVVDNNSSIRIRGAVADSLIEKCDLNKSKRGIRIDSEVIKPHCEDLGQLVFEPAQPMPEKGSPQPFLSPRGIIARKNNFKDVKITYSGTALQWAEIIK